MSDDTVDTKEFFVGVTTKPDGKKDFSKALRVVDTEGKMAKAFSDLEAERVQKRKDDLRIPDYAKPGSVMRVWYTLDNARKVNDWAASDAKEKGDLKSAEISSNRSAALRVEQRVLGYLDLAISEDIKYGTPLTADERWDPKLRPVSREFSNEELRQRMRDYPAGKAVDLMSDFVVPGWEEIEMQDPEAVVDLHDGHDNKFPVKEVLKAANNLQTKLQQEGQRSENKT